MVIGRRIRENWSNWNTLPGWLQGATYLAFLIGGPLDERDVERMEAGLHKGASPRDLVEHEEPRWMVKTLLLLAETERIPSLTKSAAYKAVAFWLTISPETVRKRCCGDPSTGKRGKWDKYMEMVDTWCREHSNLLPSGVAHQYQEIVLSHLSSMRVFPLGVDGGAVIRLPGTYLAIEKAFTMTQKDSRPICVYRLRDVSEVPGKEIQDLKLYSPQWRAILGLGFWPYREVPLPSEDAILWLKTL